MPIRKRRFCPLVGTRPTSLKPDALGGRHAPPDVTGSVRMGWARVQSRANPARGRGTPHCSTETHMSASSIAPISFPLPPATTRLRGHPPDAGALVGAHLGHLGPSGRTRSRSGFRTLGIYHPAWVRAAGWRRPLDRRLRPLSGHGLTRALFSISSSWPTTARRARRRADRPLALRPGWWARRRPIALPRGARTGPPRVPGQPPERAGRSPALSPREMMISTRDGEAFDRFFLKTTSARCLRRKSAGSSRPGWTGPSSRPSRASPSPDGVRA